MKKEKTAGIVAISIYSGLSGFLLFFTGVAMVLLAAGMPELPIWVTLIGIAFNALGVFLFVAMYGLWSIKSWGLVVAKCLYFVSIPLSIISIFPIYPDSEMTTGNTVLQLVGASLAAYIIYYLSKPKVVSLYQQ